jgi:hypothetical protein
VSGQLDLWGHTINSAPFVPSSDTSRQAARAIEPCSMSLRNEIYAFFKRMGSYGATDEEIATALHMNPSTVRPRRGELAE